VADSPQPKTTPAAVVAALRVRIQQVLGFPPERVLPDASGADTGDPFPAPAEQFVLLRLGDGRAEPGAFGGAGRQAPLFRQEVLCTLWTRLQVDDLSTDEGYLLHQTLGHLKFSHALWDALWAFQPLDAGGSWLLTEPVLPESYQPPRSGGEGHKGWGRSTLRFTASFVLDLDLTYQ
jgi:hypothetical protein